MAYFADFLSFYESPHITAPSKEAVTVFSITCAINGVQYPVVFLTIMKIKVVISKTKVRAKIIIKITARRFNIAPKTFLLI